ncbi:MAG: hypothetical protein QHI48_09360 [Bacteroidota bacterium]|nr:hypothetical protein [Bacteroidota bacterium]
MSTLFHRNVEHLFALLLVFLILGPGCDIFDTRNAEPPKSTASTFIPPTTPEFVLDNLRSAVAEKNEANYIRCLADTLNMDRRFEFVPTASAAARYSSVYASWSISSEKTYFSTLVALTPPTATSLLDLSGGFTLRTSDSAVYQGTYILTFPHGIGSAPETVQGNVQFTIASDRSSFWSIVRWIDSPSGTEPTWSDLKGRFAY